MTPEFYRGGSRSPFSSKLSGGALSFNGGQSVIPITLAVAGSQQRLKRVQVQIVIASATTVSIGWGCFIRIPDDVTVDYSSLDPADPIALRPKPFQGNRDHATYWDNYLEAINIDGGGFLGYLVKLTNGTGSNATFTTRWTEERQLG